MRGAGLAGDEPGQEQRSVAQGRSCRDQPVGRRLRESDGQRSETAQTGASQVFPLAPANSGLVKRYLLADGFVSSLGGTKATTADSRVFKVVL